MSSFPNVKKLLHVGNDEEEQHHHHHRAREEEKRRRQRTGDDTTTTLTNNDDAEKSVMKMIKKALVLISEKMCDDTKGGESDAVARLGAYLSEGKNSNVAMKGGSKVQFLLSKMQPTRERRWIPSAKNLLRLKCLNDEGKEIEKESDTEDTILYLEWKSAFYEQLWMEERTLREKMSSSSSSSSKSSSSFVVGGSKRSDDKSLSSPDGPLLREGYARTPSTAGKTSEKTMNSLDGELEECDYREWNRITRSPVLKNTRACAATHSNRSSVDDGNLVLPISNLLETLVLEEKEEGEEEEEGLREEGVITPRPTNDKNNLGDEDDDENFQFTFRTPEQSNKNKKDPQHLTPPGAPLRVRNSFRRVEEEEEEEEEEELEELNSVLGTLTFVPTSNAAKNRRRGDLCFKNVFMKEEKKKKREKRRRRESLHERAGTVLHTARVTLLMNQLYMFVYVYVKIASRPKKRSS